MLTMTEPGPDNALPPTDRELLLAAQEQAQEDKDLVRQVERAQGQGIQLAAFALGMWQGLEESGLSRDEKLWWIHAALQGK